MKLYTTAILLMVFTFSNAQKDSLATNVLNKKSTTKTVGGLTFYPFSSAIGYKSSMSKRVFIETKLDFQITNALLYRFEPSINYRIINSETVKLYTGLGMFFQGSKGVTIPFGMEFFPFQRIPTLSLNLSSGLYFLLLPGYTHIDLDGDLGMSYYFTRTKKKRVKGN